MFQQLGRKNELTSDNSRSAESQKNHLKRFAFSCRDKSPSRQHWATVERENSSRTQTEPRHPSISRPIRGIVCFTVKPKLHKGRMRNTIGSKHVKERREARKRGDDGEWLDVYSESSKL